MRHCVRWNGDPLRGGDGPVDRLSGPGAAADDAAPARAHHDFPITINAAVDDAVRLEVLLDIYRGVLYVFGKNTLLRPDDGAPVPQNPLDHHQVAAGLHDAAGLNQPSDPAHRG